MKDSRFYLIMALLGLILWFVGDYQLLWSIFCIINVVISVVYTVFESNEKTDKTILVNVGIEGNDQSGYSAFISGENPLSFGIIGEGKTVIEAKSDFLNSFYWMEQRYRERGEEFPRNVSINFYEI